MSVFLTRMEFCCTFLLHLEDPTVVISLGNKLLYTGKVHQTSRIWIEACDKMEQKPIFEKKNEKKKAKTDWILSLLIFFCVLATFNYLSRQHLFLLNILNKT